MLTGLNDSQKDALKEMISIGAGNAATALSQMLGKRIDINVPKVHMVSVDRAHDVFGDAESLIVSVYLQLLGDASGVILFSFKREDASRLANALLGREQAGANMLNEMAQSALKETATILSGAYLSAIGKMLKMRLLVSSPGLAQDMAGAMIDDVLIETCKDADSAMIADTEFIIRDEKVVTYFFFIPDTGSISAIMKAMGVGS
ncbi:MAG: chemotaxis protein CheC [Candidatus Omnitrophota bacterium]